MAFLLDTNSASDYLRGSPPVLVQRIRTTPPEQIFVSIVTIEEIMRGRLNAIRKAEQTKKYERMRAAYDLLLSSYNELQQFQIQPFDAAAQTLYENYSAATRLAGPNDCKIAATAAANGWIVITRNTRHFEKIGVAHEDWAV